MQLAVRRHADERLLNMDDAWPAPMAERSPTRGRGCCHHAPVLPDGASHFRKSRNTLIRRTSATVHGVVFENSVGAGARRRSPSTLFEPCRTRFAIIGRGYATRSLLAKRGGRTRDRTLDLSRVNHNL